VEYEGGREEGGGHKKRGGEFFRVFQNVPVIVVPAPLFTMPRFCVLSACLASVSIVVN